LRWPQIAAEPESTDGTRALTRSVGASVILRNGSLVAYLRRINPNLQVFLPEDEPDRTNAARDLAEFLSIFGQDEIRKNESGHRSGLLLATVNGLPTRLHWFARFLQEAGFQPAPMGFHLRRVSASAEPAAAEMR
jgi:ATP-dependent Lhr-like helicase